MKGVVDCLDVFDMAGAFSLLLLVAHYVVLGSGGLVPLQLPSNATSLDLAVPVK